jgi:hypothetical protein
MDERPAGVAVEDELGEAVAVPQVDEDQVLAMVAIGMDPPGQFHGLAHVRFAELPAGVVTIARFDCFHVDQCRMVVNAECLLPTAE